MRKAWLASLSTVLLLIPVVWFWYFVIFYRCDLRRYGRLWSRGVKPEWLTAWEICVTVGCLAVALLVLPKLIGLWRSSKPLGRAEWASLAVAGLFTAAAVFASRIAMDDLSAHWGAFLGQPTDRCVH
jgi:hypothetical protein